jgi:hypothetical protein
MIRKWEIKMMNTNELNNGSKLNNKGDMNMVNTMVNQLEELIRETENKLNPTLISGVKKVFRCYNEGSRTESDIQMAIAAIKAGERNAVINTQELLVAFSKLLKSKEYISIMSIEVKRNKYGKHDGLVTVTPAPIGRAYRKHTKEKSIVVPFGNAGYQTITENSFAPFVKDFISIKIQDKDDLKTAQDTGVYVLYAGRKTKAFVYNTEKKVWVDITNNYEYDINELKDMAKDIEGADLRLHKAFVYSPSDVRNFSYACKDITNGDDRDEYLNDISNGAWNRVKDKVEKMVADGDPQDKIQLYILKTMPRFGQLKAG